MHGENIEQLVGKFGDAVATPDQSKLVQISSDGPNAECPFWTYQTFPLNSKIGSEKSPIKSEVVNFTIYFDPKYMVNMQVRVSEKFLTLQRVPSTEHMEEAK